MAKATGVMTSKDMPSTVRAREVSRDSTNWVGVTPWLMMESPRVLGSMPPEAELTIMTMKLPKATYSSRNQPNMNEVLSWSKVAANTTPAKPPTPLIASHIHTVQERIMAARSSSSKIMNGVIPSAPPPRCGFRSLAPPRERKRAS